MIRILQAERHPQAQCLFEHAGVPAWLSLGGWHASQQLTLYHSQASFAFACQIRSPRAQLHSLPLYSQLHFAASLIGALP